MIHGGADGAFRTASAACTDPAAAVSRWKMFSGRKAVGCAPLHAPEELLHAAGMLPVTVWGTEDSSPSPGGGPPFLCPVLRGIFSAIRGDLGARIDAWVFPSTCDTLQNAYEVLRLSGHPKPLFPLVFPLSGSSPGAAEFLLDRIEAFREWAEEVGGRPVSEGALDRSLRVYDGNRRRFGLLEERMAESPGYVTAEEYGWLSRAGMVLPKEAHSELLNAVLSRPAGSGSQNRGKVFLSGMLAPPGLLDTLDRAGASLVGNDLALGHRYYAGEAAGTGDAALSLVRRHLGREPCSTLHDGGIPRADFLFERIRASGADRVILVRVRRCEPEGGDLPWIAEGARERGIPFLCLDTDLSAGERGTWKVRVEAFLEVGG